jgi:AraC family transcriptional regulator
MTAALDEEVAAAAEAARAIEFIETHLFDDLTSTRIARACATSVFHFSRRFSQRTGEGVMSYVRGRRLDIAAMRLLREPHTSLTEIAFDCRFESQAAFTRAFARAFGLSPDKYRRSAIPRGRTRRSRTMREAVLEARVEFIDTFHVAGLAGRYEPSTFIHVAKLWQAFVQNGPFTGQLGDGETCGVFRDRNFAAQSFEHLAGARIAADVQPAGLEVWTLPGREYLVFKQTLVDGDLHPQVAAAQAEIWGRRVPASGRALASAPDFQIYPAKFKVATGGWLAYYIPVV